MFLSPHPLRFMCMFKSARCNREILFVSIIINDGCESVNLFELVFVGEGITKLLEIQVVGTPANFVL